MGATVRIKNHFPASGEAERRVSPRCPSLRCATADGGGGQCAAQRVHWPSIVDHDGGFPPEEMIVMITLTVTRSVVHVETSTWHRDPFDQILTVVRTPSRTFSDLDRCMQHTTGRLIHFGRTHCQGQVCNGDGRDVDKFHSQCAVFIHEHVSRRRCGDRAGEGGGIVGH